MLRNIRRTVAGLVTIGGTLLLAPVLSVSAQQTQAPATMPAKHHSVLKGAVVGAVGGHVLHRKHGALMGAAVGAEIQHHRNKHAMKNPN